MTQHVEKTSQRKPAEAWHDQRGTGDAMRMSSVRSRSRWWALPVLALMLVAIVATIIGGLVVTADGVFGGAAASRRSPATRKSPVVTSPTPTPRPPGPPVTAGAFATQVYRDASGNSMTYYLYGPHGYTPEGKYPLVLVLHGGGERADPSLTADQNRAVVLRQAYVNVFSAASTQNRWPCFVVVPQATTSQRWVDAPASISSYTLAAQPNLALTLAVAIVRHLVETYPAIDSNRTYVGGISMGAFGTWEAAERWPTTFAAAFPIAGAGDPQAASALAQVPIWAFHGSGDGLVPVQGSRLMVQAVRAAGGTVCYTEYPGAAHDIWSTIRPLDQPKVLTWIFSQRRSPNGPTSNLDCDGHVPQDR
jgi:poly(3-hydroxybutyrate) depolymerase